jgi:hypothetical protein
MPFGKVFNKMSWVFERKQQKKLIGTLQFYLGSFQKTADRAEFFL